MKNEAEYNFELAPCSVEDSDYEEGEIEIPPPVSRVIPEDPLIKESNEFDFA
jgi:hypothetical protein